MNTHNKIIVHYNDVLIGHKMSLMMHLPFYYSIHCMRFFEISQTLNLLTDSTGRTPPFSNQSAFPFLGYVLNIYLNQ